MSQHHTYLGVYQQGTIDYRETEKNIIFTLPMCMYVNIFIYHLCTILEHCWRKFQDHISTSCKIHIILYNLIVCAYMSYKYIPIVGASTTSVRGVSTRRAGDTEYFKCVSDVSNKKIDLPRIFETNSTNNSRVSIGWTSGAINYVIWT